MNILSGLVTFQVARDDDDQNWVRENDFPSKEIDREVQNTGTDVEQARALSNTASNGARMME